MTPDIASLTTHPLWTTAADGLVLVDADGTIRAVNDNFERLFGHNANDLVGRSIDVLVPTSVRPNHVDLRQRYGSDPHARSMGASRLLEGLRKDGSTFPITIGLSPIPTAEGVLTIAAVRDLTDRVAVEAEVATAQRQRAIAEDHDRIASELHDTVIQQLFAVGLRLQGLPARMSDEHATDVVNQAVDAIDGIIAEIRTTIHGLRAPVEPDRGLRTRILAVVADMEDVLPTAPTLRFDGDVDGMTDAAIVDNLLPTIREALANAGRHARASTIAVVVDVGADVTVEIADDGVGMAERVHRSGLANLEARARALGGSMTTEANDPSGTVLRWVVPNPSDDGAGRDEGP